MSSKYRKANHAGSWYKQDGSDLKKQLDNWLSRAGMPVFGPARAIIVPHAGYSYCGDCAAYAYKEVDPTNIERVFILGPSHHVRIDGCALSPAHKYQTPLYDLTIDAQVYAQLDSSNLFQYLSLSADEDEHSIEMQLPYIANVMQSRGPKNFTIVPILVGSLNPEKEATYGKLLSQYLSDPTNLFVISSDFCHWGQRFRYTHYDESCGDIYQSIQHLDQTGMSIIESLNPHAFTDYLGQYKNTICGRHPIGVLLQMISALRLHTNGRKLTLKFLKYSQSTKCTTFNDSSVSYAAATFIM